MSREEKARKIRIELTQMANTKDAWSINELRIVLDALGKVWSCAGHSCRAFDKNINFSQLECPWIIKLQNLIFSLNPNTIQTIF